MKNKLDNILKARRLTIITLFGLVGLWLTAAFILTGELKEYRSLIVPIWFILFFLFIGSGLYLHNVKCPKCGNRFSEAPSTSYFSIHPTTIKFLPKKCFSCGVELGSNK